MVNETELVQPMVQRTRLLLIAFALVVAAVAGGFYSGWRYATTQLPAAPAALQPTAPAPITFRPGGFGRPAISGLIVSTSATTIVVHDTQTDTDVKITFASGARVTQTVTVNPSALKKNDSVIVQGQPMTDGSVVASAVSVVGVR